MCYQMFYKILEKAGEENKENFENDDLINDEISDTIPLIQKEEKKENNTIDLVD